MARYRWTGNRPLRRNDGDDVEPGDEFEFDRAEDDEENPIESAFGDSVERLDDDGDEDDEPDADPGAGTDAAESDVEGDDIDDLLSGTVDEVEDELESGDYDDRLDDVGSRADRQGVRDAVDDRRE